MVQSSKNWDQSSKKLAIFKLNLKTVHGKGEVQNGKMSRKRFGLFVETDTVVISNLNVMAFQCTDKIFLCDK